MKPLVLVAAMTEGGVIGANNGIPWKLSEDMKHFKAVTIGHAVIMGRKTWDSLGKWKPLPERTNIVLTQSNVVEIDGALVAHSLPEALDLAYAVDSEPRVIGGGEIYKLALPLATRIYLTVVKGVFTGDTYFPVLDASWVETAVRETESASYSTLDRVVAGAAHFDNR